MMRCDGHEWDFLALEGWAFLLLMWVWMDISHDIMLSMSNLRLVTVCIYPFCVLALTS